MNLKFIISKALAMPPHVFMRKVYFVFIRKLRHIVKKRKDFVLSTFSHSCNKKIFSSYIDVTKLAIKKDEGVCFISTMYLNHKFDLLGSGWVDTSYKSIAFGLEKHQHNQNVKFCIEDTINKSNIVASLDIYSLIGPNYNPIDWQKDFKSGFRWNARDWYLDQRNSLPGVDIKVPWEIGRLQHLPQLAIFSIHNEKKDIYIKEFRNQVVDFIALNPPRFGVQWACTMDVGIRAANMLLAFDIFSQLDINNILDEKFKLIFSKSIYEHGVHIVNNLEYGENLTSNHYLSNIVGLLFVASYLEPNDEIDSWLGFAIQEVINEMQKQFNDDGGNFEASTSYHRLSSELMIYATALILGLDESKCHALMERKTEIWKWQPKLKKYEEQKYIIVDDKIVLPKWYIDRLYNAGKFTYNVSKTNGEIAQIGDNDSGRFIRLTPNGDLLKLRHAKEKYKNLENFHGDEEKFWDENILNHQTLLSAMFGLFMDDVFKTKFTIEKDIIQIIAKNRKLDIPNGNLEIAKDINVLFNELKFRTKKIFEFPLTNKKSIIDNMKFIAYKESGIYLFKSPRLYLLISAGPNGQNGNGGHAHNDKLSFELSIDGHDVIVDAGTYLYTPLQDKRNRFRSVSSHSTLVVKDEEQNQWLDGRYGIFSMKNQSKCYLLDFGDNFLDVAVEFRGIKQRRRFMLKDNMLLIENSSNKEFVENYNDFKLYSNGYGKLVNE